MRVHPIQPDLPWPAVICIVAATALYLHGAGRERHTPGGWPLPRSIALLAGSLLLILALLPRLAHAGLQGHMWQHLLLGMYAPIMIALAMPGTLLLRRLPVRQARVLVGLLAARPVRIHIHPFTAAVLDIGGMYLWSHRRPFADPCECRERQNRGRGNRMNLEPCFLCSLPVMELEGQFDKMDSYYLLPEDDAYVQGAYGWCHALCLAQSSWGAFWFTRRRKHFTENMGYEQKASTGEHCVLRRPRDGTLLILRHDGLMFDIAPHALSKAKSTEGGVLLPVEHEMNLELDTAATVQKIRDDLMKHKRYSLWALIDEVGIRERMLFPRALEGGELRLDKRLRREWFGNWLSAKVVYERFIPDEIVSLSQTKGGASSSTMPGGGTPPPAGPSPALSSSTCKRSP